LAGISTARTRRVLVVLNLAAGQGAAVAVRQALERAFAEADPSREAPRFDVHETSPGEPIADLVRRAAGQGEGECDLVAAAGGDGTVSAVGNGLSGSTAALGIIPMGTANVLARELGIPLDLDAACRLLAGAHGLKAIDMMEVDGQGYFTQVGVGIDAMMIRDTNREAKRRFGRAAYLWSAFVHLIGFQPRRFSVTTDQQRRRFRASEVLVANCGILGQPPFRWGPEIHADDGRLDVCIVRARTLLDYARLGWHVVLHQHKKSPNVRYLTARHEIAIAARRPLPVQADGEVIGQTPVTVRVRPEAVRVVVPLGT
jgi:YegS/Rv2252/BmrU family lipid kinase